MKTFTKICFIVLFVFLTVPCFSQQYGYARRIWPSQTLPATCSPGNGDVVAYYVPGSGTQFYGCALTNTWAPLGIGGAGGALQLPFAQGTLVASVPFITHTATWNNGAVTFTNFLSNVTDTASNASSLLADWQVGGVSQFKVFKNGTTQGLSFISSATGVFNFNTRSSIKSGADGQLNFVNNAGTGFSLLSLGTATVDFPGIYATPAVGGQSQGIIIVRGDGTAQTQANLGAAINGTMIYCQDCTIANPCAGGGTGAIAKRLNGAWVCN